ncbi:hypothetical protein [Undibacterium parvum]|uniref:Uncharacterized protein n=2 Tax=Undibacterium TaxID=401469 RepID=A0A6M4A343_9BURK|nr:hypothetical protein [Undibacterium parvum]AZP11167.1 hypothetical protein EJN92_03585 [Undibacterium parvum]QJQ05691.1 hypothetical protein EJG51_007325 [Undibacterium piscinae]
MNRNEIKNAHEDSVIDSFKRYSASFGNVIDVISKPEPPDAIITINGNPSWIEITDAFFSPELAESITTHVSDDKPHKSVPKEKRFCIDPDERFSSILESVIVKKYDKDSIGNVYKQSGSGILLVGIMNPFSSAKDLATSEKKKIEEAIKAKDPRFGEVYLYDVHDHIFHRVL